MCAAVTSAVVGGAGLLMSGYQTIQGMKDRNAAKNAINNYDRQDLVNPYKDVQISTVGTDLMREEAARTSANLIDLVSNAGQRAILSAVPKIQSNTNDMNREAQVTLDNQVQKREYAIAEGENNVMGMTEARENADLAGLGRQLEVGRQDMWSGIRGIGSSAMFALNNYQPRERGIAEPVDNYIKPSGIVGYTPPLPTASLPKIR